MSKHRGYIHGDPAAENGYNVGGQEMGRRASVSRLDQERKLEGRLVTGTAVRFVAAMAT